jgi:hypothetical protein
MTEMIRMCSWKMIVAPRLQACIIIPNNRGKCSLTSFPLQPHNTPQHTTVVRRCTSVLILVGYTMPGLQRLLATAMAVLVGALLAVCMAAPAPPTEEHVNIRFEYCNGALQHRRLSMMSTMLRVACWIGIDDTLYRLPLKQIKHPMH